MTDGALQGERVLLRPVVPADVPTLIGYLHDPEVGRWWPPPEDPEWPFDDQEQHCLTIVVDEQVAGMIQFGEETDPDYRHATIDVFLGPPFHGRGLGPETLTVLIRHLIDDRRHHRVTIDPAVANERAIATYAKVGFRPVGVLRDYERDHATGGWHDCLLMDLLADDLPQRAAGR